MTATQPPPSRGGRGGPGTSAAPPPAAESRETAELEGVGKPASEDSEDSAARRGGARYDVVVTDFDRTFTAPDLALDERSLAMARRLRQAGVKVVLATGRRVQDLEAMPALHAAFDGFVMECGAVWGTWGHWRATAHEADAEAVRAVARALREEGCQLDEGFASCSVPADWAARLDARPERARLSVQPNRDRLDVVPAGVDKAVGLGRLFSHFALAAPRWLAVGDGENDLPVFAAATRSVAVANAAAVVRQAASVVAPLEAAEGFCWAARMALGETMETPAPMAPG